MSIFVNAVGFSTQHRAVRMGLKRPNPLDASSPQTLRNPPACRCRRSARRPRQPGSCSPLPAREAVRASRPAPRLDGGMRGKLQEKLAAIGVQPDVLIERRRHRAQQGVVPLPGMRNHAAAEIQGPAGASNTTFTQAGSSNCRRRADRRGQRAHHGLRVCSEEFDGQIDRRAGDLRLVALDVDDDVDVGHPSGDLGHAIGAAGGAGIGHFGLAAERPHGSENLLVVRRHAYPPGDRADRRAAS